MGARNKPRGGNHGGNNNQNQNNNSGSTGNGNYQGNNNYNGNSNMNNSNSRNNRNGGHGGNGGNFNNNGGYNSNNNSSNNSNYNNNNKNGNNGNSGNGSGKGQGKTGQRGGNGNFPGNNHPNGRPSGGYKGRQNNPSRPAGDTPLNGGNKNKFFSGDGPAYNSKGSDSCFNRHERRTSTAAHPFSSTKEWTLPFSIDDREAAKIESDIIKAKFADANPGVSSNKGVYMDFILRSWAQAPDKPLSQIHRSHGLKLMLEYGSMEEISAEVFHFLCGIQRCAYGDEYMRDDMVMCDCDGKVPRCFTAAYMELANKYYELEMDVASAESKLRRTDSSMATQQYTSNPQSRPRGSPGSQVDSRMNGDNIC